MSWIEETVRKAETGGTYKPGETLSEYSPGTGVQSSELVKLNANENTFLSKEYQQRLVKMAAERVDPRLYPSEDGRLERRLESILDVESGSIVLGNGSDQLIELLVYTLLKEGDEIVAVNPTFSMYRRAAEIQGVAYRPVDLYPDFSLNVEGLLEAVTPNARMMVICNPNNPTGNQFDEEKILQILESFDGLLVVDEAYVDYADYTMAGKTEGYSNLVVLRTFSKAYGLAGIRLGYVVVNVRLAAALKGYFQMPYTVSELTQEIGLEALKNQEAVMDSVNKTIEMRDWLYKSMSVLPGVKVFDSDTNFLLFTTPKPSKDVYYSLLERGVMIRRFDRIMEHENCLRVTIGPKKDLTRFLEALKEALV